MDASKLLTVSVLGLQLVCIFLNGYAYGTYHEPRYMVMGVGWIAVFALTVFALKRCEKDKKDT